MSRKRNETNQQWMDRLRAERGLPPLERDDLFARVRAARAYTTQVNDKPEVELAAFIAIFHPEHPLNTAPPFVLRQAVGR